MINFLKKIQNFLNKIQGLIFVGTGNVASTAMGAVFWFFIASLMMTEEYGEISYLLSIGGIKKKSSTNAKINCFVILLISLL